MELLYRPVHGAVAVLVLSALQSLYFLFAKPFDTAARKRATAEDALRDAATSKLVSPRTLAWYRLVTGVYCVGLITAHIWTKGTFILHFYTIWNWLLLCIYFLLAGGLSLLYSRYRTRAPMLPTNGRIHWLAHIAHVLFHMNMTTVAIVDVVHWVVLVPMLKQMSDAVVRERLLRITYTFYSYNEHGLNAVFMLVDMLLNTVPFQFYMLGYVGLWSVLYSVWAFIRFWIYGRWAYPFLDTSKPWAPLAYLGLWATHFVFFGAIYGLYHAREYWTTLRHPPHPAPAHPPPRDARSAHPAGAKVEPSKQE